MGCSSSTRRIRGARSGMSESVDTVVRVLDPRVYRAAFVPALLAVFVVAFSLEGRPRPATTRLAADAFDGARVYGGVGARNSLLELGARFPDRRPGSAGDDALADRVAGTLGADGFVVSRRRDDVRTVDGERTVKTVEGVRPGRSSRRIVVLSHRDALSSPGLAELSGTAAFLELARIFRSRDPSDQSPPGQRRLIGRDLRKTLVLVSTSGGSGGAAGARAWARAQDPAEVDGVLVLGDLASARTARPWVVPWSNGGARPPIAWRRTVESAVRTEVGASPGGTRAAAQWVRRALPMTVSEQGEVNRAGLPAVLLQASGERGPRPGALISAARLDAFGRAALRAVTALDRAGRGDASGETRPSFAGETSGIVTLRNVLPDWSVRLLVFCFLLPALLAALDAVFRARRRGLAVGPWLLWIGCAALPVLLAWVWLRVLGVTGALPAPPGPVLPAALPLDGGQSVVLATTSLGVALGVLAARLATRDSSAARADPSAGAAGAAAGAVTGGVALLAWVGNPYAAALLVPAAHLWLLAGMPRSRLRGVAGWLALALGLVAPALVLAYEMSALGLDPAGLARLWLIATAGGHLSVVTAAVAGLLGGSAVVVARVLRKRERLAAAAPPEKLLTRGPAGYHGPGPLGGAGAARARGRAPAA